MKYAVLVNTDEAALVEKHAAWGIPATIDGCLIEFEAADGKQIIRILLDDDEADQTAVYRLMGRIADICGKSLL